MVFRSVCLRFRRVPVVTDVSVSPPAVGVLGEVVTCVFGVFIVFLKKLFGSFFC